MNAELQHALDKASEWLESIDAETFIQQFEALDGSDGVTARYYVTQIKENWTVYTCRGCSSQYRKHELTKIAKLSHLGIKQEYCTTKQCSHCNSRSFLVYK